MEINYIDSQYLKEVEYNGIKYIQYIQNPGKITVGDFSMTKEKWDNYV